MENQKTADLKITEKFDKELFHILSNELKAFKESKNQLVKKLNSGDSNDTLLVA